MWKKNEGSPTPNVSSSPSHSPASAAASTPSSPERRSSKAASQRAFIGPSINVRGELSGDEDLVIEGTVDGEISFRKHRVTLGEQGRAKADIYGRSVHIEGQVVGNLYGAEEVILHASGSVEGNITAPRVSLENGARFKGSIDMGPKAGQAVSGGSVKNAPVNGSPASSDAKPGSPTGGPRAGGAQQNTPPSTSGKTAGAGGR